MTHPAMPMEPDVSRWKPLAPSLMLGLMVAIAWRWHAVVFRSMPAETSPPRPARAAAPVMALFEEPEEVPAVSRAVIESVVRANPFSSERGTRPPASTEAAARESAAKAAKEPAAPQFAYKGRIDVGQRRRAIVEDLATRKTYFLEVGQSVAGFKVLDITERQVVLSHPQTNEAVVVSSTTASASGP